jgi:hypothetical protein
MIQVSRVFKGYTQALKEYSKNPNKFAGLPKMPTYKQKNG